MKKIALLLSLPIFLLASCSSSGAETSSSSEVTSSDVTSSDVTSSTGDNSSSSVASSTSWPSEVSRGISLSNSFIDAAVDRSFMVGTTYRFGFNLTETGSNTADAAIYLEDSSYGEFVKVGDGEYTLTPLKSGAVLLYVVDTGNDNYLHYRRPIIFKDPIAASDMPAHMVSVDHYQSWVVSGFDMEITFITTDTAIISGSDEGTDIGSITFTYSYSSLYGDDEYLFTISDFENNYSSMNPTRFAINYAGDMIHLFRELGDGSTYTYGVFVEAEAE